MAKATGNLRDRYANIAYMFAAESAAGTLTFAQLALVSQLIGEKYALIVHRAEIRLHNVYSDFNSSGDAAKYALTVSDRITDINDLSQPEILFYGDIARVDMGTAASGMFIQRPFLRDFTDLPGEGLLVPADRLYIGVQGVGMANVLQVSMRLYYSVLQLATEDYWELIEARRVMST